MIRLKTITEVAAQFGVSARTIRYYEELGLLSSQRTEGNHRVFSKKELAKLRLIFRGKRYGFSLEEIKEMVLLFDYDRTGKAQLERTIRFGDQRLQEIDMKIAELTEMKAELLQLREEFSKRLIKLEEESNE
ncbi:MerR family transcriptional regulator [Bacillus canaveralius]|uniref:MerR family transcriptional regulator n=1 Tax=Bacillus canaveralius TaxID=1403243 RepID=UPI00356B7151